MADLIIQDRPFVILAASQTDDLWTISESYGQCMAF